MDLKLAGKVAIVTGASRGIGRSIAQVLAEEGVRTVLAARSEEQLVALASDLPTEALPYPADLRVPHAPAALVEATIARFGQLDLLVNNAGSTTRGDFLTLDELAWAEGFSLKFFGAMRCCREAWPHLHASGGSIVNIAGVGGRTGSAEFAIGGSVNAALLNLTKVLADRGVREGVRVNAINPGSIATDRLRTRVATVAGEQNISEADAEAQLAQRLGVARFGAPEEIARTVAFLASPLAAYLHGAIIDIDGGQTRTL